VSWVEHRIGEFAEIKHGFSFKSEFFVDEGELVVLTPGNCHENGGFRDKGEKEKFYRGNIPDGYLLRKGDLIVVMTDLVSTAPVLGGAFAVPEDNRYLHNQRLGLVEVTRPDLVDKRFLYFLFNSHNYRAQVRGSASGATVRHTSPNRIKSCVVRYPSDVRVQAQIADTLSAYDDLIENNRRRIALLEEASRMLYREWFVHFRFPGHEHAKIIDGVPEGWERKKLANVLTLKRGYDLPEDRRVAGDVPIVSSSGITGFHNDHKAVGPGVVTGRYGTLGQVYYVEGNYWPLNTALYVHDYQGTHPLIAFHLLTALLKGIIAEKAAVPGLNRNVLHAMVVTSAPERLQKSFVEVVDDQQDEVGVLRAMNQKLAQARDLLLPRLMNGEIAV
jgi:type I restriction enzyme S subunit